MSSAVPVYFLVYILGYDLVIVSDLSFADSQQEGVGALSGCEPGEHQGTCPAPEF